MNAASSPPPPPPTSEQLHTEMKRLLSSDNSVDIATLAYVWGFPLIFKYEDNRSFNRSTVLFRVRI
jgi:hypothetical protein